MREGFEAMLRIMLAQDATEVKVNAALVTRWSGPEQAKKARAPLATHGPV